MNTADICDGNADVVKVCSKTFQKYGRKGMFHGCIRTVKCWQDNSMVKKLLNSPGQGNVLVVDGQGCMNRALLGDQIAQAMMDNKWEGVIINGFIRDSELVSSMDVGVRALGTCPMKTVKLDKGEIDIPISFGDIEFIPGQYVYCDQDGIVTTPGKV